MLQKLWRQGALVASIAYVIARVTKAAIPDEALMTGLMVSEVPAFKRLRLSALDCQRLLAATAEQIKTLQAALAQ